MNVGREERERREGGGRKRERERKREGDRKEEKCQNCINSTTAQTKLFLKVDLDILT